SRPRKWPPRCSSNDDSLYVGAFFPLRRSCGAYVRIDGGLAAGIPPAVTPPPKSPDEEIPKLFVNRPFRLERSMAFSDWNLQTVEFLTMQPGIREFEIALCVKPAPKPEVFPHSILRKCNMLITAPGILASFTVPPPLRFLHVDLNDWGTVEERVDEATEIGMFGNTLTSLAVARRYVREGYLSMAVILEGFAAQCSKLASNCDDARIRRLVSDNFPNLRMFVWGPLAAGIWRNENDGWSSEEESDGNSMWTDDHHHHNTVKMERYALFVGFDGDGSCRHSRVWRRIGTGEDTELEEILDHWRRFDIVEQELRYVDPNDPEVYMMTGYVNPMWTFQCTTPSWGKLQTRILGYRRDGHPPNITPSPPSSFTCFRHCYH
ncbi:hypothetical protein OF83DRAFT_1159230, partial [Amylostereum chailletii]